jgi:hypothetical protein
MMAGSQMIAIQPAKGRLYSTPDICNFPAQYRGFLLLPFLLQLNTNTPPPIFNMQRLKLLVYSVE